MSTADAFAIATKIEETRTVAKRLLGDRYDEKAEPWRVLVRALAAEWKCSPLAVVPRLEREGRMPEVPLLLIAASADVVEEPKR